MNSRFERAGFDEVKVFAVARSDQEALHQVQNLYYSYGHTDIDLEHPSAATFIACSSSPLLLGAATVRHTVYGLDCPQHLHIECWEATTRKSQVVPELLGAIERYGKNILETPKISIDTATIAQQAELQKYGYVPTGLALVSEKLLFTSDQ